MAIKIIEQGAKRFQIVCPICNTKYSYELEDIRDGVCEKYTICPVCNNWCEHKDAKPYKPQRLNENKKYPSNKPVKESRYLPKIEAKSSPEEHLKEF